MPSDQMDFQGVLNSQCLAGKRVPWNRGRTKETDERIRRIAERLKEYYRRNPYPQKGKKRQPFTLEHRMKLSQAHLGKKPWYPSKYKPEMPKKLTDFFQSYLSLILTKQLGRTR